MTDSLERDPQVEKAKQDVQEAVAEVRGLTPGQVLDEAIRFFRRDGGGEGGFRRSVNEDPLPLLLFAAAGAWFLWSALRSRREVEEGRDWAEVPEYESVPAVAPDETAGGVYPQTASRRASHGAGVAVPPEGPG